MRQGCSGCRGFLYSGVAVVLSVFLAAADTRAGLCQNVSFEAKAFIVCELDLARDRVELRWRTAEGAPLGSLGSLVAAERKTGAVPDFAMNAGMYEPDLTPVGLYIERGRELAPLNTRSGRGNFYLKPNGVFYWGPGAFGVSETTAFARTRPNVRFATQSGPMLVIDGKLHPAFLPHSQSLHIRNGVGIRDGTRASFVLSVSRVTFHRFARFFRDKLKCRDALYLDGSVSSLYAPSVGRADLSQRLGPMLMGIRKP